MSIAENDLVRIQRVLNYDGNDGLGDIKRTFYLDLDFVEPDNPFSSRRINQYNKSFSLNQKKLNEIDTLLDEIKKLTAFLKVTKASTSIWQICKSSKIPTKSVLNGSLI